MASSTVGTLKVLLTLDMAEFAKNIEQAQKSFKKMGRDFESIGKTLTVGITAPLVAIGTAAFAAANKIDEGLDKIRSTTGKTGKEFEALGDSFRKTLATVPNSVEDTARAIGELNTRLGLTGKPLEDMSKTMLDLSRLSGEGISEVIRGTTRVFQSWGVATKDQAGALDYLYKVSQQTGIGITSLSETLTGAGAQLREMGFSLEKSAALLGKFEKEGINAEAVMMSMKRAIAEFSKKGISAPEAFQSTVDLIKSLGAAGKMAESNAKAFEFFGAKAGLALAEAIRKGRLEMDDFVKLLKDSPETIAKAAEETLSFGEKMSILGNKILTAFEPLGKALIDVFDRQINPAMLRAVDTIKELSVWFAELPDSIKLVTGALIALGPVLIAVGASLKMLAGFTMLPALFRGISAAVGTLAIVTAVKSFADLGAAFTLIVGAAGPLLPVLAAIGLAIAAWKIGDKVYEVFKYISALNKLDEVQANLEAATNRAAKELEKHGIFLQRNGKSTEEWANQVQAAGRGILAFVGPIKTWADNATKAGTATSTLTEEQVKFNKAISDNVKKFIESNSLTKEELGTYNALIKAGYSAADAYSVIADKIEKIMTAQKKLIESNAEVTAGLEKIPLVGAKLETGVWENPQVTGVSGSVTQDQVAIEKATGAMQEWNRKVQEVEDSFQSNLESIGITVAGVQQLVASGADLGEIYRQFGGILDEYPELLDKATKRALEMGKTQAIIKDGWINIGRAIEQGFSKAFSDALMKARSFRDGLKSILTSIKQAFFSMIGDVLGAWVKDLLGPMLGKLKGITSGIGAAVGTVGTAAAGTAGGMAAGGVGGGGGMFGGISAMFSGAGGAMGGVGALAAPLGYSAMLSGNKASQWGGLAGAGFFGGMGALGGLGMGGILAAGIGGAGIGAAVALLASLLIKQFTKTPAESAAKETARDLGGVQTSSKTFESFLSSVGITSKQAEGIRKDLISSPKYLTEIAYPLAQQQGKVTEFLKSLESIQTVMGTFNFRAAFELGLKTGDFAALNKAFEAAFKDSKALVQIIPDFALRLAAATNGALVESGIRTRLVYHPIAYAGPTATTPVTPVGGGVTPGSGSGNGGTGGGVKDPDSGRVEPDMNKNTYVYAPQVQAIDAASFSEMEQTRLFPDFLRYVELNLDGSRQKLSDSLGVS